MKDTFFVLIATSSFLFLAIFFFETNEIIKNRPTKKKKMIFLH